MSNSTLIINNNASSLLSSTPAPSDFCITCGFDFGNIISGIDNKIAGFFFVVLVFTLICTPCIVATCCYMCRKAHKHPKSKRKNKYSEVDKLDEDNDESDGEV